MSSRHSILVIEDDDDIRELLKFNLEKENYQVMSAASGEQALQSAEKYPIEMIILDIMLPDMDGFEICRRLKRNQKTFQIPIIMLTARGEEADIVSGLELGADDYITKPFSPKVLIARIRSILRRQEEQVEADTKIISVHGLTIDSGRHQAKLNGKNIKLTGTEFKLIYHLASKPGWVFSRDQLVDIIRGENVVVTDRTIDVHIAGLRKKLGSIGKYIETVRGMGYRLSEA